MTVADKTLRINRVLIALDTSRHDNYTLDTAARLAAVRNVELVTLFIEDQDLLQLAEFPFASEIEHATGAERKLDRLLMARALKTEAQRLSRRLEGMTRQLQLRYSLRVVRGRYLMEARAAAVETDILFLSRNVGKFRRHRPGGRGTVFARRPASPAAGTIWAWHRPSAGSGAALAVAAELAAQANRRLVVLQPGEAREAEAVADIVRQRGISYTVMSGVDPGVLDEILQGDRNGLLVVHASDLDREDRLTLEGLEDLGYPVAVVF